MQNHHWPWAGLSLALVILFAILTPALVMIQAVDPPPRNGPDPGSGAQGHPDADSTTAEDKLLLPPGSTKAVTVERNRPAPNEAGRYWAFVVGVSQYPLAPLSYTVQDAHLIAETLIDRGYSRDRVVLLTDSPSDRGSQPTKRQVEDRLTALALQTQPDDTLLFYFSGHGVRFGDVGYLVPIDAENPLDTNQLIALDQLKAIMQSAAAEKQLMIFDACHSGSSKSIAVVSDRRASDGAVLTSNLAGVLPAGEGLISIGSSDENQLSYEAYWRRQGLFTHWFARGLQGEADINGDGLISVFEIYNYTFEHVRREAMDTLKRLQEPRFTGSVKGNLFLTPPPVSLDRPRPSDLPSDAVNETTASAGALDPAPMTSTPIQPIQTPSPAIEQPSVEDTGWPSEPLAGAQVRNSLGMALTFIPNNTFTMGDVGEALPYPSSTSPQTIELTRDFWIGTTEVTVGQFLRFLNDQEGVNHRWLNLSAPSLPVVRQGGVWAPHDQNSSIAIDHPMTHVTWHGAQAFLVWLSEIEGRLYTLPTEAQWEYAARAGTDRPFHFAVPWDAAFVENTNRHANLDYRQLDPTLPLPFREGGVLPVASFAPNAWGLFDMHGNVREWCLDHDMPGALSPGNAAEPFIYHRVRIARGGGWADSPHQSHAFANMRLPLHHASSEVGFRAVAIHD